MWHTSGNRQAHLVLSEWSADPAGFVCARFFVLFTFIWCAIITNLYPAKKYFCVKIKKFLQSRSTPSAPETQSVGELIGGGYVCVCVCVWDVCDDSAFFSVVKTRRTSGSVGSATASDDDWPRTAPPSSPRRRRPPSALAFGSRDASRFHLSLHLIVLIM